MALRVLNDRVLVKPDEDEITHTNPEVARILKAGILVAPDAYEGAYKKIAMTGTVVSWGSKCRYNYNEGDRVLFGRFSGVAHTINDVKHILLVEEDIHAKEEND